MHECPMVSLRYEGCVLATAKLTAKVGLTPAHRRNRRLQVTRRRNAWFVWRDVYRLNIIAPRFPVNQYRNGASLHHVVYLPQHWRASLPALPTLVDAFEAHCDVANVHLATEMTLQPHRKPSCGLLHNVQCIRQRKKYQASSNVVKVRSLLVVRRSFCAYWKLTGTKIFAEGHDIAVQHCASGLPSCPRRRITSPVSAVVCPRPIHGTYRTRAAVSIV